MSNRFSLVSRHLKKMLEIFMIWVKVAAAWGAFMSVESVFCLSRVEEEFAALPNQVSMFRPGFVFCMPTCLTIVTVPFFLSSCASASASCYS